MAGNQYSNAPNWKPTTIFCKVCGIEKRIKPCHINKTKYCSKECYAKDQKGKPQSKELIEKRANSNRGQKRSLETKQLLSAQKIGDKNPAWKGGISKQEKYRIISAEIKRYGMTKEQALKVLGDKCSDCKMTNQESIDKWGINLAVHHKDHNGRGVKKPNNDISNLEILCTSCHSKHHLTKEKAQEMNRLSRLNR
jgi:hypothetical protein